MSVAGTDTLRMIDLLAVQARDEPKSRSEELCDVVRVITALYKPSSFVSSTWLTLQTSFSDEKRRD